MPENIFNKRIASNYDFADRSMFAEDTINQTCSLLEELAGNGRVLEFAIGTGRVALPLQERGVEIHGIELSQSMVDQLYSKPNADTINVVVGDMAKDRVFGEFQLVYLVYNTITNLITQEEQVDCFINAAAHLKPGGYFLIEDQIPTLQQLPVGKSISAFDATEEHVGIDEFDLASQLVISRHYWIEGESVEMFQSKHRYAWPGEYDLMARIAGLELHNRWAGWDRSEFGSESKSHISIWRKPI